MAAREIMTIQIRDGIDLDFDEIDRNTNTPRTRIGWDEALASLEAVDPRAAREEVWHRSSGWWKLEPGRAIRCDLAIVIDPNKIVRCVANIDGVIKGGMIPKVDCCVEAVRKGVERATILDGRVKHSILIELLSKVGAGTMFQ